MHTTPRRLFVRRAGAGVPLVIAHGIPFDHVPYAPLIALENAGEVLLPDLTGMGRSTDPDAWDDFGMAGWVEDIEHLRREEGVERIVLFGHSAGGHIALQYAVAHPDRLLGLILCGTSIGTSEHAEERDRRLREAATAEQLAVLQGAFSGTLDVSDRQAFEDAVTTVLPLYFHGPVPWNAFAGSILRPKALLRYQACLASTPNVRARLTDIQTPTLVLHGRHDRLFPLTHTAVPLADGLPHGNLVALENSGHFPWLEEPDAFLTAIRDFLATLAREA